jgi:hypothetical protein
MKNNLDFIGNPSSPFWGYFARRKACEYSIHAWACCKFIIYLFGGIGG